MDSVTMVSIQAVNEVERSGLLSYSMWELPFIYTLLCISKLRVGRSLFLDCIGGPVLNVCVERR